MSLPRPFTVEDASASIQRTGVFALEDRVVGTRLKEFSNIRFPIKTPLGLEFIAQNSFAREDIRRLLESILGQLHLGLIKVFSQVLPSAYAFRFHNGSPGDPLCLLVQLWSPDSVVCFYDGSISQVIETDPSVSKGWGLLATPKLSLNRDGISTNVIMLKEGGLTISDSRLHFSIIKGYTVMVGFPTQVELEEWRARMELPYSDAFRAKIDQLESGGVRINYAWLSSTSPKQ